VYGSSRLNLERFYKTNKIPIYLIFIALLIFGIISIFYLDFNLIPDIEYPELIVITYYPNATPSEVKNLVTKPIEEAASSLKGLRAINSVSKEGMGIVRIAYQWNQDLDIAQIELREKMDLLKSFMPRDVKRPIILNYQTSEDPIAGITLFSDSIEARDLYLISKKDISPAIEKTQGISLVTIRGGVSPEVKLLIDPESLVKYNLGISEIKDIINRSNKSFPVGFFHDEQYEWLVRVNGEVSDYRELGNIVLKEVDKKLVYLKDVAKIEYGAADKDNDVQIDGRSVLLISVYKQPSFNIIRASRNIDEKISMLNKRYGGSIVLSKVFDESVYIKNSLKNLIIAMIFGILFTIFSIYFFLYNLKISLLIVITVPLSIISTFIIMKFLGLSINLLTLGGFSLAIGMMVDNSVIVVTSVFDLLYQKNREKKFYKRLRNIIPAVFSATFTTVVVFLPVIFLSGILKLIFIHLSIVIVLALIFSLIIAVTLIPILLDKIKIKNPKITLLPRINRFIETSYKKILLTVLNKKLIFIIILVAIIFPGIYSYRSIDKCFIESIPPDYFYLKLFINQQVTYEYTERFSRWVSKIIKEDKRVLKILSLIGANKNDITSNLSGLYGENTAILKITTSERGSDIYDLIHSIRDRLRVFKAIDFVFTIPDNPVQRLISRSDFDVALKLFNPSSEYLAKKVNEISSYLKEHGAACDILNAYYLSNSERSLIVKREKLSIFKVDVASLGEFIGCAVSGLRVGKWKKDEYDIPIVLRFKKESLSSVNDITNFKIKNSDEREIKLGELIDVKEVSSPNVFFRENQKLNARLEFNIKKDKKGGQNPFFYTNEKAKIREYLNSQDLDYKWIDQFELLRENYSTLFLAIFLAVFLEYVILASQFKSFSKPILIILMIPMAIPGLIFILFLLNSSLNISTFMSVIVLIGLLVNNAIMLFLEYDIRNVNGKTGLVASSTRRLKPILITTFSTSLALVPTLFTQNRIQITLALTLIFGLLYSTFITILYLPMLYDIFYLKTRDKKITEQVF